MLIPETGKAVAPISPASLRQTGEKGCVLGTSLYPAVMVETPAGLSALAGSKLGLPPATGTHWRLHDFSSAWVPALGKILDSPFFLLFFRQLACDHETQTVQIHLCDTCRLEDARETEQDGESAEPVTGNRADTAVVPG